MHDKTLYIGGTLGPGNPAWWPPKATLTSDYACNQNMQALATSLLKAPGVVRVSVRTNARLGTALLLVSPDANTQATMRSACIRVRACQWYSNGSMAVRLVILPDTPDAEAAWRLGD